MRLLDATSQQQVTRMDESSPVVGARFSPNGRYLVTWTEDRDVHVYEIPSGRTLARMRHSDEVAVAMFNNDGSRVATASPNQHTVFLWESSTGRRLAHAAYEGTLTDLLFDPAGRYLVGTAVDSKAVLLWDVRAGLDVIRVPHQDTVTAEFSADGRYFASASNDGTARVWRTGTTDQVALLSHAAQVYHVAFSSDGRSLATSSRVEAHVWDLTTQRETARMNHGAGRLDVRFTDNDRYLLTVPLQRSIRKWLLRPQNQVTEACARLTRNFTRAEWRQYPRRRTVSADLP